MTKLTIQFTAAASIALAAFNSQAAGPAAALEATTLEAVIVTPNGNFSASEWQARKAAKLAAVMLDRVIVTPKGTYSVAEWQTRRSERMTAAHRPPNVTPQAEPVSATAGLLASSTSPASLVSPGKGTK